MRTFTEGIIVDLNENPDPISDWKRLTSACLICSQREGYARVLLEPLLAMRALLPLASLRVETQIWEVINLDENAVLCLILEDARVPELGDSQSGNGARLRRLRMVPIKGYRRVAE